jgi:hypothetical protein
MGHLSSSFFLFLLLSYSFVFIFQSASTCTFFLLFLLMIIIHLFWLLCRLILYSSPHPTRGYIVIILTKQTTCRDNHLLFFDRLRADATAVIYQHSPNIFLLSKPSLSICWNDKCSLKYNKNGNTQRKWLGDARSLFILKFEKKDPRNVDRIWILKK